LLVTKAEEANGQPGGAEPRKQATPPLKSVLSFIQIYNLIPRLIHNSFNIQMLELLLTLAELTESI
jgi:hypothetical protein